MHYVEEAAGLPTEEGRLNRLYPTLFRSTDGDSLVVVKSIPSASQLRQDHWAIAMSGGRSGGYFVDIGAFDGYYISNTVVLEEFLGWRGILVEPNPIVYAQLCCNRTSTCIERAVLPGEERMLSFLPAGVVGTIAGYEDGDHHRSTRKEYAEQMIEVRTISPTKLLEDNGAPHYIDFMSIDTEGTEWEIVSSFDLNRWRVALFTIEHNHIEEPRSKIRMYLESHGYKCVPAGHDDFYWHPGHLKHLNGPVLVDYDRVNANFRQP